MVNYTSYFVSALINSNLKIMPGIHVRLIKSMGWTYSIAVVRDVLLDSWHSHCALRSIVHIFKSATSNPG